MVDVFRETFALEVFFFQIMFCQGHTSIINGPEIIRLLV